MSRRHTFPAPSCGPDGFSLTEVVLALGIATFCIISLVSLLPLGLNVVQNSQEQAAGAACLNQLATDIRKAIPETNGDHRACGIYSNIVWRDQTETFTMNDISLGGTRTTLPLDQRLTAYVRIEPSTTSASGRAFISVAWPNRASWDVARSAWTNAQGSVSSWLILLPGQ